MNESQTSVETVTQVDTSKPAKAKTPRKSKVSAAIAAIASMDQQAISAMAAELVMLRAKVKPEQLKKAVDSDTLNDAVETLKSEADADLTADNPRATPNLSLSGVLGFIPDMTKEQAKAWRPVRDELRKRYSNKHRELWGKRKAILSRVARDKSAILSTTANQRKDSTYSKVALVARQPAKAKPGKGLGKAKPAQIAGKVPVAGNAANPATVS